MSKIAIFASGAGSNADRIFQFLKEKNSSVEIDCFITNKKEAGIYHVAERLGVPIFYFSNASFKSGVEVIELCKTRNVEWIVLAGFLRKVELNIIEAFENKIFNLHPSLLPKYGGKGMYGKFVHQAVLEANESESGISIHLVNHEFDKGEILFQAKCEITEGQTVEELTKKIRKLEHENFPGTVVSYIENFEMHI